MNEEQPKKITPFTDGNRWRFPSNNKAAKRVTVKQLRKRLETLLALTEEELKEVSNDKSAPTVVRDSANNILNGKTIEVADLINRLAYETWRKKTQNIEARTL